MKSNPPYNTDELVEMMFGKVVSLDEKTQLEGCEPAVEVSELSIEDYRLQIRDANLTINCGEVIGLAGMEGSGSASSCAPWAV